MYFNSNTTSRLFALASHGKAHIFSISQLFNPCIIHNLRVRNTRSQVPRFSGDLREVPVSTRALTEKKGAMVTDGDDGECPAMSKDFVTLRFSDQIRQAGRRWLWSHAGKQQQHLQHMLPLLPARLKSTTHFKNHQHLPSQNKLSSGLAQRLRKKICMYFKNDQSAFKPPSAGWHTLLYVQLQ